MVVLLDQKNIYGSILVKKEITVYNEWRYRFLSLFLLFYVLFFGFLFAKSVFIQH